MTSTVLITGTSSGIGLATAVTAARVGHRVVATMRDPKRAASLSAAAAEAGVEVDVVRLDVTDPDSIRAAVAYTVDRYGGLDVLVNNAGYAASAPTIEQCDLDRYRAGFEVNFFGTVAVTKAALPHLRAARGRVITVGSTRGVIAQPFNECYSAAKYAVTGFLEALAPTANAMGVDVVLVEPGPVFGTAFAANAGARAEQLAAEAGPYRPVFDSYLNWFTTTTQPGGQTPEQIADILVDTLTAVDPPFRILTSDWANGYAARKLVDPSGEKLRAMTTSWLTGEGEAP